MQRILTFIDCFIGQGFDSIPSAYMNLYSTGMIEYTRFQNIIAREDKYSIHNFMTFLLS